MEKYCNGCLHHGENICELPSRAERVGRAILRAAIPLMEGIAVGGAMLSGAMIPAEGYGIAARKDAGIELMNARVAACVTLHEEMDQAEAEGVA